jgi:restriction system protein
LSRDYCINEHFEKEQEETLKNGASRIENLIHWAEIFLVKGGVVDSSKNGVLTLNENSEKKQYSYDDILGLYKEVKDSFLKLRLEGKKKKNEIVNFEKADEVYPGIETSDLKKELISLLKSMSPNGFERLCQRLLREAGFEKVIVTGKSSDGGIDGHGVLQINSLLSFKVIFQCKRYEGSVSTSQIRDFRGAMAGRADKGIFLTTGRFTSDAVKEALRDGVHPIELVDGEKMFELFEKIQLGIKPKTIYEIDYDFFSEYMG